MEEIPTLTIDGGTFMGNAEELTKQQGFGEMHYKYGGVYVGQWCNGLRHGFGYYRFLDGSSCFSRWENGVKEGPGVMVHGNGDYYAGWLFNNKKQGTGVYIAKNGAVYEGDWKEDMKHGRGKTYLEDTCVYDGEFAEGQCQGVGITRRCKKSKIDVVYILDGMPYGDGIRWSADLDIAYRLQDGTVGNRISPREAMRSSAEIGLPVPSSEFVQNLPATKFKQVTKNIASIFDHKVRTSSQLSRGIETMVDIFQKLDISFLKEKSNIKCDPVNDLNDPAVNKSLHYGGKSQSNQIITENLGVETTPCAQHECDVIEMEEGIYNGTIDPISRIRSGNGIMMYNDGTIYDGEWKNDMKEGQGIFYSANGEADCSRYVNDQKVETGVKWNANRTSAWRIYDGEILCEISLNEAYLIHTENDLKVPD